MAMYLCYITGGSTPVLRLPQALPHLCDRGTHGEEQGCHAGTGTLDGLVRTWTAKRIAEQERWKVEDTQVVAGTTSSPGPHREGEEVHIRNPGEGDPRGDSRTIAWRSASRAQLLHQEKRRRATRIHARVQGVHGVADADPPLPRKDIQTSAA